MTYIPDYQQYKRQFNRNVQKSIDNFKKTTKQNKQFGFLYSLDGRGIGTGINGEMIFGPIWNWDCNHDLVRNFCISHPMHSFKYALLNINRDSF